MSMKVNHKTIFCFSLMILLFVGQMAFAETLKSTVDRSRVGEDETVNLVITLDDASFSGNPDILGLDNDFQIVNSSTSSSTQIINGAITSKKEWRYVLLPKKLGKLIIPSFKVKGAFSDAIEIEVLSHNATQQQNNNGENNESQRSDLFLEESIDKKEAYVQERMTLTLRIYTAIEIARPEIPDPSLPDFMVEKLGQSEYQSRQNGRNYYVLEYKYAMFANKSGKITLPRQHYEINQIINNAPRSMFDIRGFNTPNTQAHFLSTPDVSLTIKPQPDNLPAPYWFPGEDVSITDNWPEQQSTNAGTPLTRNIEIKALGSLAALIPPLTIDAIPGLKSYAEQPELNNSHAGDNLLASRKESIAIVPTQSGTYILPAIHIHWWDTKTKQFKTSSIAERVLTVKAAANAPVPVHPETQIIQPEKTPTPNDIGSSTPAIADKPGLFTSTPLYLNTYLWIAITLFVLILWIITLLILLKHKNRKNAINGSGFTPETARLQSLKKAFKELQSACTANDAKKSRENLLLWAKLQWPENKINTLDDVKKHINNKIFTKLSDELDSTLYREAALWNGKALLQFLQAEDFHAARDDKESTLPKLYG